MLAVIRLFEHLRPLVVETFEKCDEQSQKDAVELAAILSRKNNCEYKVMIDLSCTSVVNDPEPFQK